MAAQNWVSLLIPNTVQASGVGPALNTAATATLSPARGDGGDVAQVNAEGQYLGWSVPALIRITARGFITATATQTTYALSLNARVGNTGSTYIALTGAHATLQTGTTAITGIPWSLEALIRCTSVATSGNTLSSQAELRVGANPATAQTIGTATAGLNFYMPSASGETNAAVDTTQIQGISLRCVQGTAGPTIQLTQWLAEALC